MSSVSMQIFIYRHKLIITHENNYPFIRFRTKEEMYAFIASLVSFSPTELDDDTETYFVINNPQLLPSDVRKLHTYTLNIVSDDSSDEEGTMKTQDGIFLLSDNFEKFEDLPKSDIDNNTNEDIGFYEVIHGITIRINEI